MHRFLWRNFETEREPDVYVKSVLTFGDKPAPAMTQVALRKTAEEAMEEYPQAAKTVLDNSYMDDICDSVSTVKNAQQLMKDVESVSVRGIRSERLDIKSCHSRDPIEQR